jgi:hypothetical protein
MSGHPINRHSQGLSACLKRATEKYSERADIFPSSADNIGGRLARLSSGGRECFHSISNIPRMPLASALPAPEQTDKVLLAGWKQDIFLLIRYRPRDPVCVPTAALRRYCCKSRKSIDVENLAKADV